MSAPEAPAQTDIERLLASNAEVVRVVQAQTDAINGLGANVQWMIDNVKGIFEMFSNPAFMSMLPGMMGGVPSGGFDGPEGPEGPAD